MSQMNIVKVFSPASVVVIGASREEDSVGQSVLSNLKENNFTGQLLLSTQKRMKSCKGIIFRMIPVARADVKDMYRQYSL